MIKKIGIGTWSLNAMVSLICVIINALSGEIATLIFFTTMLLISCLITNNLLKEYKNAKEIQA